MEGTKLALNTNSPPPGLTQSNSPITSPVTSPPYWVHSHQRSTSNTSVESIPVGAITLLDNTDSPADNKNKFCWAKSVYIEDHVMVNEHRTGIGAFVVWNVTVETLRVCSPSEKLEILADSSSRDHLFVFANATRNSWILESDYFKHFPIMNLPCQNYRPRAWYLSLDRSF